MFSCELFEENLNNKTYMELSDWLTSCRQVVLRENFDSHADYLCAVDAFCSEWEEFYRQNEDFFKKKAERFKKAVLFASYKKNITCTADYGTKEVIPSESIQNLSQSFFGERLIDEIDPKTIRLYMTL